MLIISNMTLSECNVGEEAVVRAEVLSSLNTSFLANPSLFSSVTAGGRIGRPASSGASVNVDLQIPNCRLPGQHYSFLRVGNRFVIRCVPTAPWPMIEIELSGSDEVSQLSLDRFAIRPSTNSTVAEIRYTEVMYWLSRSRECKLVLPNDENLTFRFDEFTASEDMQFRFRAKLFRKLRFIEDVYSFRFSLPEVIPWNETRKIDTVFRAITEGAFSLRSDEITFPSFVPANDDELDELPLVQPGEWTRVVGDEEEVLGLRLPVGPITIHLENAILSNSRVLEAARTGIPMQLRFRLFDHQIHYNFEKYSSRTESQRRQRLQQFVNRCLSDDPIQLAALLDEPLALDVNAVQATAIVDSWLQIHEFPDAYSAQTPSLEVGKWRVPVFVVSSQVPGRWVQDVFVDLKSGIVESPTPVDELQQLGRIAASDLLRAS